MHDWKFGLTLAFFSLLTLAPGCGDDDGGGDPTPTGGRAPTGGQTNTGGDRPATGGQLPGGGAAGEGGDPSTSGGSGEGGAAGSGAAGSGDAGSPSGEGGAAGAAPDCNIVRDFVPSTADDDPGPACQEYADCMSEGCGELYEPAFGPDWEEGDLSGGACGASIDCFEGCGCDQPCFTACLAANLPCAGYAISLQTCFGACMTESDACQAERAD